MSNYDAERLWSLLPAVYRQRDAEQGGALRELIGILAEQAEIVARDLERLYDNHFIETCDDWVVPYIGDLIGVRGLSADGLVPPRAEVADTLAFRRRKGTAAVLEDLARTATGWPARVVEYFELLATTQFLNHLRPHNLRTPDLRDANALELLDGPFDTAAHTVEARRIAPRRGRYNIPNVGLHLWRLIAFPLHLVEPRRVDPAKPLYTFDVLGRDLPLFTHPATETALAHVAGELDVPAPIRRRAFHHALASYYGADLSVAVFARHDGEWQLLPATDVVACDLTDWDRGLPTGAAIAIDPVLGRLKLAPGTGGALRVRAHYGFSDALGGGQYERGDVSEPATAASLAGAFTDLGEDETRIVEIADSGTYPVSPPATPLKLARGSRLVLRAADRQRPALALAADLEIEADDHSRLEIDGLLISGGALRVTAAAGAEGLKHLALRHVTLVPGLAFEADGAPRQRGAVSLAVETAATTLTIERSIVGALRVAVDAEAEVSDSIVDAHGPELLAYAGTTDAGGSLRISRSTVIGGVETHTLALGESSLFLGPVNARRRQQGCVRFSYLPVESRAPRRFRCQPAIPEGLSEVAARCLAARLAPGFTSLDYGDPGYCQLSQKSADEILRGADDESEMGVFASLRQPQRLDHLRSRLDEYLAVGLEAGILFAT